MAQLDIRKQYADGSPLQQQDLDAFVDDIETFFNLTKLNNDNIQDDGITASTKLAAGSVTNAKFANSTIATAKITDSSVTTAKIEDGLIAGDVIAAAAVTSAKIAAGAITTSKITDANITDVKISSNLQVSADFSKYSTVEIPSATAAASVSITTTTTRPVLVKLIATTAGSSRVMAATTIWPLLDVIWKRTTSGVDAYSRITRANAQAFTSGVGSTTQSWAGISFIDDSPGIGTHTYTLYIGKGLGVGGATVAGRLLAMEL